MRKNLELSLSTQRNFPENTISTELAANVGLVLLRLASRFSGKSLNQIHERPQKIISKKKVEAYLAALAEKIKGQDEDTRKAWVHFREQMAEEVGPADWIRVYVNDEEQDFCFDLKTALALVYAALTDKKAFSDTQFSSLQKLIMSKKELEASYAKGEEDRLAMLWDCFKSLQTKSISHTDMLGELTMTLNVYYDLWFIESLEDFLHELIAAHIQRNINAQKEVPTLYCKLILAEMRHKRLDDLSRALEQSKPRLRQAIEQSLADHGTNPKKCSEQISNFLAAMKDLTLVFEDNELMSSLSEILKPSFKTEDKYLVVVKNWVNQQFEFDHDLHASRVISFARVQKTLDILKQHQVALSGCINARQLEQLNMALETYKKCCVQKSSPQIISKELGLAMQIFEKDWASFRCAAQYDWIENFFSQWALAGQQRRSQLYSDLYDATMQEKYLVTTEFLDSQLAQKGQDQEITSYLINRIFLHAIAVHPQKWDADFFKYLSQVYDFVSRKLNDDQQGLVAPVLKKRNPYSRVLMCQLKYLQDYYLHLQDRQGMPEDIVFYIPMKQLVLTAVQLCGVIKYLPTIQIPALIDSLGNGCLELMIRNLNDLNWVLSRLSATQTRVFIASLSHEFLKSTIKDSDDFIWWLKYLPEAQRKDFMRSMDDEFLKSTIGDSNDLALVTGHLADVEKKAFLDSLSNDFLKSIVRFNDDLGWVLGCLSVTQIPAFVVFLGAEFLASMIKNCDDLRWVVKLPLDLAQRSAFIASLGTEFLKPLIQDSYTLDWVLKHLSADQKEALRASYNKTVVSNNSEKEKNKGQSLLDHLPHFFHQKTRKSRVIVEDFNGCLEARVAGSSEGEQSELTHSLEL